jgi:predicted Na+-dependent transporter
MFGLGMNNNGTGLVLASATLADHPLVMLPIIFYNLVQHLMAAFEATFFPAQPANWQCDRDRRAGLFI